MQTIVAGLSSTARGTMLAFNGSALNLVGVIDRRVSGRIIETAVRAGGFWSVFLALCAVVIAWRVLPRQAHRAPLRPAYDRGVSELVATPFA